MVVAGSIVMIRNIATADLVSKFAGMTYLSDDTNTDDDDDDDGNDNNNGDAEELDTDY
jgi:hypothetical protein